MLTSSDDNEDQEFFSEGEHNERLVIKIKYSKENFSWVSRTPRNVYSLKDFMISEKICKICGESKSFDQFRGKRGLICKDCVVPLRRLNSKKYSRRPEAQKQHRLRCQTPEYKKVRNETSKVLREERASTGVCYKHPERPAITRGYCEACWFKNIAWNSLRLSTKVIGTLLKELLEWQQYKCPYTGELILIGINASIDHKIPRVRKEINFNEDFSNSIDVINNICFTPIKINNFKGILSSEDMLVLAENYWKKYEYSFNVPEFYESTFIKIWDYQLNNNFPTKRLFSTENFEKCKIFITNSLLSKKSVKKD